jgi:dihydroorotase-like cyclic amidohydrolase
MSTSPARLFGIPLEPESSVEIDLDALWTLPDSGYQTLADWTPFAGMTVRGRVLRTTLRGRVAFDEGVVRAKPGTGHVLPFGPRGRTSPVNWERGGIL